MSRYFILLLLFLTACSNSSDAPELIRPVTSRIDTAVADYGDVISVSVLTGITRMRSDGLYFENPTAAFGEFLVGIGEHVKKGQLLLTLDTEQMEEEIKRLQLELERMIIEHDILQRIASQHNDAWGRLNARQERERQELQQKHLQADIDRLIKALEHTALYAKADGIVTWQTNHRIGDHVYPFEPLIFISDPTDIFVEAVGLRLFDFPRTDVPVPPLAPWIPTAVNLAVTIHGYAGDSIIELEYIPLEPEDRVGRTHPDWVVAFDIIGQSNISYGEYVSINLYSARELDVLRVPAGAVFQTPGREFYVHRIIDGQMVRTTVEVTALTGVFAAISSGLTEGDVVFVRP